MDVTVELSEDAVIIRVADVHPVNSDTARDIASELALRLHNALQHCTDGDAS